MTGPLELKLAGGAGTAVLTVDDEMDGPDGPMVIIRSRLDGRDDVCVAAVWAHDRWVQLTAGFPPGSRWQDYHLGTGGTGVPDQVSAWLGGRLTDAELDVRLADASADLLTYVRAHADLEPRYPAPGRAEPLYPDIAVVLHATSAVISAGRASQALSGYGVPWPQVRAFIAEIEADRYAHTDQIIARWVTVTGRAS